MKYEVYPTQSFLILSKKLKKKYPSIVSELEEICSILEENPFIGTPLGNQIYKIRMAVSSKGKGKSGGVRIITFLITEEKEVYLVYIYDKGELDNLTKDQIHEILKNAGLR